MKRFIAKQKKKLVEKLKPKMKNFYFIATIGLSISPFIQFFKQYIFSDVVFIFSMCLVVAIDTGFGTWLSIRQHNFSTKGMMGFFKKIIIYILVLIAVHQLATFKTNGIQNEYLGWLDTAIYAIILVREILSIFENTAALGYFFAPEWLSAKLKKFSQTGKFE